jgi:uncharacterized protein involved in exopolysaccharide biosynthesis
LASPSPTPEAPEPALYELKDFFAALRPHGRALLVAPVVVGALTLGITFLIPPTFTATTTILPPAQQSSSALSAIASQLGGLAGLAGAASGIKNPADQYVAFLRSRNISDRMIAQFDLRTIYDKKLVVDTRQELTERVRIQPGKKDGLISIEVDDHDPTRAAAMANAYVDELRRMTSEFAVGEAAQRRLFFEGQLKTTRALLSDAEQALVSSGVSPSMLNTAPQAAVTAVAKLKASITAQEVRIASLQGYATEENPNLRQARLELAALQTQLEKMEEGAPVDGSQAKYTEKYRTYKYNEALFELLAKQYELARLDEAREGALIQVIDAAEVPEKKSKPKRASITIAVACIFEILLMGVVVLRGRASAAPLTRG